MNYDAHFHQQLEGLRREGRYRLFADWSEGLERFPVPRNINSAAPAK